MWLVLYVLDNITSLSNTLPNGTNKTEEFSKLSEHFINRENFEA